jgi:hypothetical protein
VRNLVGRFVSNRFGQPEVEHLHGAVFAYLDVRGFQIAMDDALLVRSFECLGDLSCDGDGFVNGYRPAGQPVGDGGPLHQFHDQRQHTVRLLQSIESGDVLVIQRREDLRLPPKTSDPFWIRCKRIGEHFQGIVAVQREVMRSPDLAHAAFTNQRGESIGAESRAGRQRHSRQFYADRSAGWAVIALAAPL